MTCPNCKFPFAPHELIDGLCHRCTAAKVHQLEQDLRVANCALVDLKCSVGELTKQVALQKARAEVA